jgi:two-component system C4-dicarboxylate transport response regulator DctD
MHEGFKVIFVEDDPAVRDSLTQTLELAGFDVSAVGTAEQAAAMVVPGAQAVVVTDVRLPGMDGLSLLDQVVSSDPHLPVILITGHGEVSMAVGAMRKGAYDFIEKPFAPERLVDTVVRAVEKRVLRSAVDDLRRQLQQRSGIAASLLGQSVAMQRLRERIQKLASTSADVMILGETGTGKELVARCLHDHSSRCDRNYVAINCGGLPESMFESELFGHEAGAFTSAARRRIGKIEHANGGTLLFDEIESMPMLMQTKLLRVIQERRLERLGSNAEVKLDLRIVAATKCDLLELSNRQAFRADLYYRLNVAVLRLPPLRERREDIPLLFQHFIVQAESRYGCAAPEITPGHLRQLMAHDWPGNVREVRNAADRFVLSLGGPQSVDDVAEDAHSPLTDQMDRIERALIEQALRRGEGRVSRAMELLGTAKKTFYDKVHKHGISLDEFR